MLYSGFSHPSRPQSKNQRKHQKRQVPRPCQRTEKAVEHNDDSDTNHDWLTLNGPQRLGTRTGRVRNRKTNWGYPDYNIVEINQDTQKSFGDLGRLAITQTPVKCLQLMLARRTHKKWNNNITLYIFMYKSMLCVSRHLIFGHTKSPIQGINFWTQELTLILTSSYVWISTLLNYYKYIDWCKFFA